MRPRNIHRIEVPPTHKSMTDQERTHDTPAAQETYEEFELDDERLVVYDADNPDAWLASDARTDVHR